ncbi:MAG: contractile injection system protein, VgrG/Pvc8 family, partial [Myxococcota bacterium]
MGAGIRLAQPQALLQMLEASGPTEIMVIGDSTACYGVLPGEERLQLGRSGITDTSGDSWIESFRIRSRIVPTRATVRDFDPRRAGTPAGRPVGTVPNSTRGTAADVASAAVEALAPWAGAAGQELGQGGAGALGAVGSAADVPLTRPENLVGGALNESQAHGLLTATHGVMSLEAAVARSATAFIGRTLGEATESELVDFAQSTAARYLGGSEGALESYEHGGQGHAPSARFGDVSTRLEQLRARHIEGSGTSHCRRVAPGRTFKLTGHEYEPYNTRYAFMRAYHEWGVAEEGTIYTNAFDVVPSSVCYRPPRPERRICQVTEQATLNHQLYRRY